MQIKSGQKAKTVGGPGYQQRKLDYLDTERSEPFKGYILPWHAVPKIHGGPKNHKGPKSSLCSKKLHGGLEFVASTE